MTVPVEVRTALLALLLHGSPVTEQEYRKIAQEVGVSVTAGYLMVQGFLKQSRAQKHRYGWMNEFELSERGLEAIE